MNNSISVIIVTYNRIDELKKTLQLYEEQTLLPHRVFVIDNASKDETADYLEQWKSKNNGLDKIIYRSPTNIGGAGGFKKGIELAMEYDDEFIFLADDDAYPDKDMLEKIMEGYESLNNKDDIAAVCTRVKDQYGISRVHRARIKRGIISIKRAEIQDNEYDQSSFDVDLFTFVGAMIKRSTIETIGLPLSEYFIHEDDAEYSTRIRSVGRIVCIPASQMFHPYGGNATKDWIEYYTTRNYVDFIGRHFSRRYQIYAEAEKYIKKCSVVAGVVKHRSRNFRKMNMQAIRDGRNGRLGICEQYKPGQKIG